MSSVDFHPPPPPDFLSGLPDDTPPVEHATSLFLTIMVTITVVMLNMLIALMSSTYERATEHSAAASKFQRGEILLDIEATMTIKDRANPVYFPKYLHVLKEKQSATKSRPEDAAPRRQEPAMGSRGSGAGLALLSGPTADLLAKVSKRQDEQAAEMSKITQMLEKLCDVAERQGDIADSAPDALAPTTSSGFFAR
jgi:hypothetical protein